MKQYIVTEEMLVRLRDAAHTCGIIEEEIGNPYSRAVKGARAALENTEKAIRAVPVSATVRQINSVLNTQNWPEPKHGDTPK